MQIHEYLTNMPQVGRRDDRVYTPRCADSYCVPPPPGDHRRSILGMRKGRGKRGPANVDPDDVHAVRRWYMTPLVQMEEAERQFYRGQVAEDRKRQQIEDNRREPENMTPEIEIEATEEIVGINATPPMPSRPEPIKECRLRPPASSDEQPEEERPEISTPHSRPLITISVTSEGIREVSTGGDRVVPPTSTVSTSVIQEIPPTTWESV